MKVSKNLPQSPPPENDKEFVFVIFKFFLAYIPNEKTNARDANTDKGRINEISVAIIIFKPNSFSSRTIELSKRIEFNLDMDVGFPFAKLLRNETQKFSFFAHHFCAKKNSN